MSRLFLGVDGGQTATLAFIGDEEGRVLGAGKSGPSNHVPPGGDARAKFQNVIRECVAAALEEAKLPADSTFEVACLGFSGGPDDKRELLAEVIASQELVVTTDASIALTGATGGEPGIITIAGTGSISHGRNAEGRTARAGGWGYIFGDEGGAFDVFRQALRAALRQEEGWGPPTVLREELLKFFSAANANTVIHDFYHGRFPKSQVAQFARKVEQAAIADDRMANDIIRGAAGQLVLITKAVRRHLFGKEHPVRIAFAGGMFQCDRLRIQFTEFLSQEPGNEVGPPAHPPAAGALLEAYRARQLTVALQDVPKVAKSAPPTASAD